MIAGALSFEGSPLSDLVPFVPIAKYCLLGDKETQLIPRNSGTPVKNI